MEARAPRLDVRSALKVGIAQLAAAQVPSHSLAAELLLMYALGHDRAWLYSHPEESIAPAATEAYFALVARRAAGEPTQYLTGTQEFWGLAFEVTPAVLIPRPETEHVIEVSLERLRAQARSHQRAPATRESLETAGEHRISGGRSFSSDIKPASVQRALAPEVSTALSSFRIADVGTGSGCIAIALAYELPASEIFATDISASALDVARRNAARHGVSDRIHFLAGDLLSPLATNPGSPADPGLVGWGGRHSPLPFDLIVSNPPYISHAEAPHLQREVLHHEPHSALFAGPTGIEIYSQIIGQAVRLLRSGGILVLELGHDSAAHVREIFGRDLRWTNVSITLDLAGIERVLAAQLA